MSAFDPRPPFKKRLITVSVTEEQRAEVDRLKAKLDVTGDGELIKLALARLSHAELGGES